MIKHVRYIVQGSKRLKEHTYSTLFWGKKALDYAISCAEHPSMYGRVYGQKLDGSTELVYESRVG